MSALFAHFGFYAYDFLLTFLHLQQLLSMSRDKSDRLSRLYARMHWLDRYNATLVTRLSEANARADQVTPLEVRIHGLERELARANSERDAQRAAADQNA